MYLLCCTGNQICKAETVEERLVWQAPLFLFLELWGIARRQHVRAHQNVQKKGEKQIAADAQKRTKYP